jgi:serine/threonine protein kinase
MGVVYRAWQPSIGRQVALKCLLRAGDPKAEARFAREIRALGKVDHPNLVKIYTSGSAGDQWFYAMELVEGTSLALILEVLARSTPPTTEPDAASWHDALSTACEENRNTESPISDRPPERASQARVPAAISRGDASDRGYFRQVAKIIRSVADAAHALHEAGVVHRDIKLGNVMVSPDGLQVVLMDLGLAQLADQMEGKLTRTRQFIGTLRYASPEQVLAADRVDRRSDIYSLGVMLWELVTLRPLYDATDDMPTPELMKRIQYAEPKRPRVYRPSLPADLEAIVLKCLEKDPARRYPLAQALSEDLNRWLNGEPVHAHSPTIAYTTAKWLKRHRWAVAGVVVLVLTQVGIVTMIDAWSRRPLAPVAPETRRQQPAAAPPAAAAVAQQPEPAPPTDPKTQAILEKLDARIDFPFQNDAPLEDVLKYISAATTSAELPKGIPIYVDEAALKGVDKTMASAVNLSVQGASLRTTLAVIVDQLGLSYKVENGALTITETAEKEPQ